MSKPAKDRPTAGSDGRALPILPPDRDARVWARMVRVMFYTPGFLALLLLKTGEPAAFGITIEMLMLSSVAAVVGGLFIGSQATSGEDPAARTGTWSGSLVLELLCAVPFVAAIPALFHELATSTLLHAKAPGAATVELGASEPLPAMAILPFVLYQLAGFGTLRAEHPLLLDPSTDAHHLRIPRGFALVGDDLFIANAWRKDSHLARYHRNGDTFHFAEVVVSTAHVPALVHPFDVQFADDGRIYASCQDTNIVVAILPQSREPAPVASHLSASYPDGNFLPGTVVASSQGQLPEVGDSAPLDVPSPQGLKVVLDKHGKPRHSVRGIIVHRKLLYVADEAGDAVKIFETESGRLVARIKGRKLTKPVHLLLHGDTLLIGAAGSGSLLAYDIPAKKAPHGKLKARVIIDGKLKAPSGFAVGPDGDLYVAERFKQRVRRFSKKGKKKGTFRGALPDVPEFLLHVPDRAPVAE